MATNSKHDFVAAALILLGALIIVWALSGCGPRVQLPAVPEYKPSQTVTKSDGEPATVADIETELAKARGRCCIIDRPA